MLKTLLAIAALSIPLMSQAQDAHLFRKHATSCSARAIDEYYCPVFSNDWRGPYFDNGCSVKCSAGQTAVCREAHCDDSQSGQQVDSRCACE